MKRNPLEVLGVPRDLLAVFAEDPDGLKALLSEFKKRVLSRVHPDLFAADPKRQQKAGMVFGWMSAALDEVLNMSPIKFHTMLKQSTGPSLTAAERSRLSIDRDELKLELETINSTLKQTEAKLTDALRRNNLLREHLLDILRAMVFPSRAAGEQGFHLFDLGLLAEPMVVRVSWPYPVLSRATPVSGRAELVEQAGAPFKDWNSKIFVIGKDRMTLEILPAQSNRFPADSENRLAWEEFFRLRNVNLFRMLKGWNSGQSLLKTLRKHGQVGLVIGSRRPPLGRREPKSLDEERGVYEYDNDLSERLEGLVLCLVPGNDLVVQRGPYYIKHLESRGLYSGLDFLGTIEKIESLSEATHAGLVLNDWFQKFGAKKRRKTAKKPLP